MKLEDVIALGVTPKVHSKFEYLKSSSISIDDNEDTNIEIDKELLTVSGIPLVIEYKNSKNQISQRLISCKKLSIKGEKKYLHAFCHQCYGPRTFRTDRVIDIFDPESGESLSPVEAYFTQFVADETSKRPFNWGLSVRDYANLVAFLNALIFVARCDKEYHPFERETLESAIVGYWIREELKGDPETDIIIKYADKLAPDGETFWLALHGIRERTYLTSHFKKCAGDIIAADGVVNQREHYWAVEIEQFLRV